MAIRIQTGDDLRRTASLPAWNAFTVCGWFNRQADPNGFGIVAMHSSTSDAAYQFIGTTTGENFIIERSGVGTSASIVTLATGDWIFWAIVGDGTNLVGYAAHDTDVAIASQSVGAGGTYTPAQLWIGNDSFGEFFDGRYAFVKVWDAALTAQEIAQERWSALPKRFANLNFFWPLRNANETQDWGNNKRDATVTGTLGTEDGPPVSWSGAAAGLRKFSAAGGTLFLQSVAGTLTTAGVLIKQTNKTLAGTLTTAGALTKEIRRALSSTLSFIGSLTKQTSKTFVGTLSFAGALTSIRLFAISLTGTLSASGTIIKQTTKMLTGTISFVGALVKQTNKIVAGTLTMSGTVIKMTARALSGVLGLAATTVTLYIPATAGGTRNKLRRLFTFLSGR